MESFEGLKLVEKDHDEIICNCMQVSRGDIIEAIAEKGLTTIEGIGDETEAGEVCESCHDEIQEILNEYVNK
jgi:NAD(P)H-nitrite reductase large subunit